MQMGRMGEKRQSVKSSWRLIISEERDCGRLYWQSQNSMFSHIKEILSDCGNFPCCSLPNISSLRELSALSGKGKTIYKNNEKAICRAPTNFLWHHVWPFLHSKGIHQKKWSDNPLNGRIYLPMILLIRG